MLINSNKLPIKVIGAGLVADDLIEFLSHENVPAFKSTLEQAQQDSDPKNYQYLVGILGDIKLRQQAVDWLAQMNLHSPSYVHPTTVLYDNVKLGAGTIIYSLCVIQTSVIGEHCIISSFSMVSHGATVGNGVVMYPYACILGSATVASNCLMQSRSTVNTHTAIDAENVNLLPNTFITKDITTGGTYGGTGKLISR